MAKELRLGNLDARRDWGFAGEYVDAMWRMPQQEKPDDYVAGTEVTHSVREFCELAFGCVWLNYQDFVVQDPRFMHPSDVDLLISDPSKASRVFGWEPKVKFQELVEMMAKADLKCLKDD